MMKRVWFGLLILIVCKILSPTSAVWRRGEPPYERDIHVDFFMPKVQPKQADDYYCTALHVNYDEAFIVHFEPKVDNTKAYHMLLFGCANISNEEHVHPGFWNCDRNEPCKNLTILYGWAQNTPPTTLPPDVGFRIGEQSPIKYLVLQVHYASSLADGESDSSGLRLKISRLPQRFLAGIHVLYSGNNVIPPGQYNYHIDINCRMLLQDSMFLFAYRVHTHSLGIAVSGYKYNVVNSSWSLLAKGNPHWPQAFYPMNHTVRVQPGDILATRCTYNTMRKTTPTLIGRGASMEMCNMYFMYYALSSSARSSGACEGLELPGLTPKLPADDGRPDDLVTSPEEGHHHDADIDNNQDLSREYITHHHQDHLPINSQYSYKSAAGWPLPKANLGQVVAVSVDRDGNIVVFHRGSRIWAHQSFSPDNVYQRVEEGPVPEPTVVTFDAANGHVTHQWGDKIFYMPHGLTVDSKGYIWITDVALHQVHKYPPKGSRTPEMVLGKAFKPGNGEDKFCKPTSVAITTAGDFYVADGYCNGRVVHFDKNGKYLKEIGSESPFSRRTPPPGTFSVPHKVITAEREGLFCVADRENGRIQCFGLSDGSYRFQIALQDFHGRVFSIAYSPAETGGLLLAVSNPDPFPDPSQGFIFNLTSLELLGTLAPPEGSFTSPHDIACTKDAEEIYIGEIGPNRIWRFIKDVHRSTKKILDASAVADRPHVSHHGSKDDSEKVSSSLFDIHVHKSGAEEEGDNFGVSMVIMALLAIPVLSFIVITIIVRLKKRGKLKTAHGSGKNWLSGSINSQSKFDLGKLLNPHRGFDRVALEESDGGVSSDTDVEEFNVATRKA